MGRGCGRKTHGAVGEPDHTVRSFCILASDLSGPSHPGGGGDIKGRARCRRTVASACGLHIPGRGGHRRESTVSPHCCFGLWASYPGAGGTSKGERGVVALSLRLVGFWGGRGGGAEGDEGGGQRGTLLMHTIKTQKYHAIPARGYE
jgi:hypothetical protein